MQGGHNSTKYVPPHNRMGMGGQVNNSTAAGPNGISTRPSSSSSREEPNGGGRNSTSRGQGRHQHERRTATGRGRGIGSGANQKRDTLTIIETTNFQSNFHAKLCRAAKYKVHAPYCSCPKIVKLRQRFDAQSQKKSNHENNEGTTKNSTTKNNINAYSNNEVQFDIDGNISHQLSQLDIASNTNVGEGSKKNNTGNSSSKNSTSNKNHFDNLIVLPDTKSNNPIIYVCNDTDKQMFQRNGTACERKLASEIFGHDGSDNNVVTDKRGEESGNDFISQEKTTAGPVATSKNYKIPPFKVNCAICLLTTHQRNGFVAIVSQSLEEIQPTIQHARDAISNKVQQCGGGNGKGLHADHAHFVCALELSSLQSLLSSGKTRDKDRRVTMEILTQMRNGGIGDFLSNTKTTLHDINAILSDESSVQIKMGHHLTSLLWLLLQDQNPSNSTSTTSNNNLQCIMVMGYVDGPRKLELDLPGGKRHLGESTLQGAIREVEEECSLRIDRGWFAGRVSKRYGGERDNQSMANATDVISSISGEDNGGLVQVLEPRKIKGSQSGDAFFVMTPPPTS